MRKSSKKSIEMRAEYDFTGGVRGKYAAKYARGTNLVLLDPALMAAFPDSESVNEALRALLAIAKRAAPLKQARALPKSPNGNGGGTKAADQQRLRRRARVAQRRGAMKRTASRS